MELFKSLKPLDPISTEQSPHIDPIEGIRAVLFDIYGTLIISSSGDIGSTELVGQTAIKTFQECQISFKRELPKIELGKLIVAEYEEAILRHHNNSRAKGIPHPEVDIIEIWQDVVTDLDSQGIINKQDQFDFEQLAITFEIYNNPIYPMPEMNESLQALHQLNLSLGIVSNAQFFTPMFVNFFMNNDKVTAPLPLFNPDYCIYSFEHKRAKPDTWLYEKLAEQLAKQNITPNECLYVGNDMLNDIYPASKVGFNTVLYAGDIRSLRLRQNLEETKALKPSRCVTELKQLLNIVKTD